MAEEKEQDKNEGKAGFGINFDDPQNPTVMIVSIPIDHVARDGSDNAFIYMLGWLENLKNISRKLVGEKRDRFAQSKVITPSGLKPNGMKVH